MTVLTCVICSTALDTAPVVNTLARNDTPQTSVACPRCGLVQVTPMPSAEEVARYYSEGSYRSEFPPLPVDGVMPGTDGYEAACDAQAADAAAWLVEHLALRPGMRVHEVGCGAARVVKCFWRNGYDATAWDPDPMIRWSGGKDDSGYRESPTGCDVVYAMQVLEHATDPIATLREWRAMLTPTGRLHVQVPTLERMYGGASHFFQRPHVVNFTTRTLHLALWLAGFHHVVTGINGSVLWATATVATCAFTLDEALTTLPPADDVPALIRAHEEERGDPFGTAVRRAAASLVAAPHDELDAWLADDEGRDDRDPPIDAIRRMREELRHAVGSVQALAETMQRDVDSRDDDWHADPLLFGMALGEAAAIGRYSTHVSAIANALIVRNGT